MKRGHSTKKISFGCPCFGRNRPHAAIAGASAGTQQPRHQHCSHHRQQWHSQHRPAPHRKNAALHNRSDSPYEGQTAQKDNPTQLIIKQAVDFLIQQLEAGKSETSPRICPRWRNSTVTALATSLQSRGGLRLRAWRDSAHGKRWAVS